jgi:hypothetical protein
MISWCREVGRWSTCSSQVALAAHLDAVALEALAAFYKAPRPFLPGQSLLRSVLAA